MRNIEKIIFNTLASHQNIGLPGVGALVVMHASAEFTDDEVAAPVNTVQFVAESPAGTRSIIDIIADLGVDRDVAQANYEAWLEEAQNDTGIYVKGVGILKNDRFYITKELDRHLNPVQKSVQNVSGSRFSRTERIWMVLIPLFILILAGGWWMWWYNEGGKKHIREKADKTELVQSAEQAVAQNDADAQGLTDGEAVAEKTESAIPATKINVPRYHVVGGVFAERQNVDNYIDLVRKAMPGLQCKELPFKGMTMVSLFSSTDENEANRQRNKIANELYNNEIWVYKEEPKK